MSDDVGAPAESPALQAAVSATPDKEVSAKEAMLRAERAAEEYEAKRDLSRGQEPAPEAVKPRRGRPPKDKAVKVEAAPVEAVQAPEEDEPDAGRDAAIASLKAQAKKLGLEIEDGVVTVADRVAFRQEKRRKEAALEQKERDIEARYEAGVANLEKKYGPILERAKVIESGDADGIAKMLGYKSFGEWSMEYVHNQNNPERKKMRALEERLAAAEEERERARKDAEVQHQTAAQREAEVRYREWLSDELAADNPDVDPLIAELCEDQPFLDQVIHVQKQHWDPRRKQTTINAAQAAQIVIDNARKAYLALHKRFGDQAPTPERSPATRVNGEQQAHQQRRPPRTVSQSASADASGTQQYNEQDPAEFERQWRKRTAEALSRSTS